jgi:hypothetical protein
MEWTRADFLKGNIAALTYEIHDQYFNLQMMRYDERARLWSLPIGEHKEGPHDREIVVSGVTGCRVRDSEKIGIYDIHSLRLDDKGSALRLKCNVPLGVWLSVAPDFSVKIVYFGGHP